MAKTLTAPSQPVSRTCWCSTSMHLPSQVTIGEYSQLLSHCAVFALSPTYICPDTWFSHDTRYCITQKHQGLLPFLTIAYLYHSNSLGACDPTSPRARTRTKAIQRIPTNTTKRVAYLHLSDLNAHIPSLEFEDDLSQSVYRLWACLAFYVAFSCSWIWEQSRRTHLRL